jgi:2-iminobutanoate/2-iminopropanoate deaminase
MNLSINMERCVKSLKRYGALVGCLVLVTLIVRAAEPDRKHFPAVLPAPLAMKLPPGTKAPFSSAVYVGNTLYVAGVTDVSPVDGKPAESAEEGAKFALDSIKKSVEAAGMTMDELVWVQVFCTDLSYFPKFNAVYRTYFSGELPARAFLGVDHLLGDAHFEIMGIAVKRAK